LFGNDLRRVRFSRNFWRFRRELHFKLMIYLLSWKKIYNSLSTGAASTRIQHQTDHKHAIRVKTDWTYLWKTRMG
jgi:hypothetical protein